MARGVSAGVGLPFGPFQSDVADYRVVVIPASLDDEKRARFVTKVAAAVQQQAAFAEKSDAVLRLAGETQVRDERIIIPHEPAAPADPAAVESASHRPDIKTVWWLSWSLVRALKAAGPGTPHGGIQLGTLYRDQAGRLKLGDFGIAPAFEAVCGIDRRRQVHCDASVREVDASRRCSGLWSLLGEDEARDHGWIAPYFGHELLEGTLRLNPKADQFAAGVVLFLLATGEHPYGASLGDQTLMLYFHLEPFAVRDERSDWAEVFERDDRQVSVSADKPILAWTEFVQRLLSSDAGERFANPAEAEAVLAGFCPEEWAEASTAISAGQKLLDAAEVDGFLENVARWKDAEVLPELWREQLSGWVGAVESQKDAIGRYKRVAQRLAEGQQALNNVEVGRAREIAREVQAAPECDGALRAAADELVELCDEQQQFIESGADDLARAYLESARECVGRGDFDEARHLLDGLVNDPATPGTRATQARQLIAEVELIEQHREQQQSELAGAGDDVQAGRYEAARRRLEALLEVEDLPEDVATDARSLLEDVTQRLTRRARYLDALNAGRAAWERAELEALEEHLTQVPEDCEDPKVAGIHAELASRVVALRMALEKRAAAEQAAEGGELDAALAYAEEARAVADLPERLRNDLDEFVRRCESRMEKRQRERLAQVVEALGKARTACEALRVEECRQWLAAALEAAELPDSVAAQARELQQVCERLEKVQAQLDRVRQHLADEELDAASEALNRVQSDGVPVAVTKELERLGREVLEARERRWEQARQRLVSKLDVIDADVQAGELDRAASALREVEESGALSDELRGRAAAIRSTISDQRYLVEEVQACEAALAAQTPDPVQARVRLEQLPSDLPAWAAERVSMLKQRVEELAERQRRAAVEQATAAVNAAQVMLDAGDVAGGRKHLDAARGALELDAELARRHEELTARAVRLEEWLPKVAAVSEKVERGELASARRELSELLSADSVPALCRRQLTELKERTEKRAAARQREIERQLAALQSELEQRGRRARRFPERVAALRADPLATDERKARADELLKAYGELPEPKRSRAPLVGALCAVAVAVIGGGLYFGGVFGRGVVGTGEGVSTVVPTREPLHEPETSTGEPTVPVAAQPPPGEVPITPAVGAQPASAADEVREQIVAALVRLRSELADVAELAKAEGRTVKAWELVFEPPDELPTTLYALDRPADDRKEIGLAATLPELELLCLTAQLGDELFPAAAPAQPKEASLAEVGKAYLDDVRKALGQETESEELLPTGDGKFEVSVKWSGRDLRPFVGLEFDEREARFSPPPATVATYFRLLVEALEALREPFEVEIPLGEAGDEMYPAKLRLAQSLSDVAIEQVDLSAGTVRVGAAVQIEGDPRAAGSFAFTGVYINQAFAADEAVRRAFADYLRDLQKHQMQLSLKRIGKMLELPGRVELRGPDDFAGGSRVGLRVEGADERVFATLEARWSAEGILYEVDADAARNVLRDGVRQIAEDDTTRARLAAAWPELRAELAPAIDQPGMDYLARCELLGLVLAEKQPDEPFAVVVQMTVGPRGAADDEQIRFPAGLALQDGRLAWDSAGAPEARAAITDQLRQLATGKPFRARRQQEALGQLAAELGVSPDKLHAQAEGDALRAEVGRRVFTWTWDTVALQYGKRVESAPPALSLDDKLAQLAAQPAVDIAAFAEALAGVTQAKVERYGAGQYVVAGGLGGAEASAGLLTVTANLQRLVAPTPTRGPFPVVFIEYFVGESDVYGLSWRAVTDADDNITGVSDAQAWHVMPAAKLESYATPSVFREDYSTDGTLGEGLLGPALGDTLEGSASNGGGSFGVMIAPDGLLWLTRWEQVRFSPRPITGVDWRGAGDPGPVSTLRQLLKPAQLGERDFAWRRAGVWCVPALAGEWQGAPDQVERLQLGVLVPGNKPSTLRFRRRGELVFASVTDPTLAGDFGWTEFARSVRREEIGYLFWDRRWSGEQWNPTPFTSFALIQIP